MKFRPTVASPPRDIRPTVAQPTSAAIIFAGWGPRLGA
jgi:hypothetical protein